MKILFLTYSPSPYRVDFFEELGKIVDLTVCFETTPEEDKFKNKRDEAWYGKTSVSYKSEFLKKKRLLKKNYSTDLIKIIKNNKYDLIVIGGYSSLTAMMTMQYLKLKRIPFVLSTDGGFPKENESRIKYLIKKYFISMADYYLSTGKNASNYLSYYGANLKNIYYYPFTSLKKNDILDKKLSKNEKKSLRKKLGLEDKTTFISIGRFINVKGFDIFIKASKNIKDAQFLIIGDKPTEEYISLVKKYELNNIIFIDFKPKEELIKYLKASDVFVLCTRGDVWGLVINEALSMGLPVITTKKCGAGLDLIKEDYNGYLIEVDDVKTLHNKMNYFVSNEKEMKRMGKNALNSIRDYTIENEAIVHYKIFNEIKKKEK